MCISFRDTDYPRFTAYTLDEVEEKTKALRASANYTVGDNASGVDVSLGLL